MTSSVQERRVEQEWKLLLALAAENPEVLQGCVRQDQVDGTVFRFRLLQTQALVEEADQLRVVDKHDVTLRFPRFFPAVPIEASLERPVFHPNVHPESGFVCLWDRFSSGNTAIEALTQLQRVISWKLHNEAPDHTMQPEGLRWYQSPERLITLPLLYREPLLRQGFNLSRTQVSRQPTHGRRRLEEFGPQTCSPDSAE